MPFTSDQIAAQTAAFQQQSMMQMQNAGMISQFAGSPSMAASHMTGSAINTAAAVGQPLIAGGMMLAGMDPLSMGMRGAWAARGSGMLGMGAAGLGAAAMPMMGMMAAQYAGGQVMTGMREQQVLGQQLSTGFSQTNSYGGRGFTRPEIHSIGTMMRDMTTSRGPGGEFATMDELGRLAANMGRMGMAQGVKDAKEFREKFSQMVNTVKQIAQDFSTSLEDAQKIMGSMRGAGVFGAAGQGQLAGMMRGAAVGGGVSMGTLGQMVNIGSQISRSIGGRGRAGAVAGVETAGMVGAALQSGVLSEEDIYNATGLTGEAGTQAMATNMMSINAKFLRGGLGRRVVAAMAGKDGNIDEGMARAFRTGSVGTGETMQEAYGHLGKVGRANFIRNEGRLRGESLRALGPLGVAQIAQGWLSGRGMDMNNMGDKEMLFFQRQFGVDRDEADNLLQMSRNLDSIKARQSQGQFEDRSLRDIQSQQKTQGLEGVKRKLEDAKQRVNNSLREVGSSFLESMTSVVERTINTVTGDYVRQVEKDIAGHVRALQHGGMGSAAASREFGFGVGGSDAQKSALIDEVYGLERLGGDKWASQNADTIRGAGYKFDSGGDAGAQMRNIQSIQAGVRGGGADIGTLGGGAKSRLQTMLSGLGGRGAERLAAFRKMDLSGSEFAGLRKAVQGAGSDAELARVYGSAAEAAGIGASARGAAFDVGDLAGEYGMFNLKGEGDIGAALAKYVLKSDKSKLGASRARPFGSTYGVFSPTQPSSQGADGLSANARAAFGQLMESSSSVEVAEATMRGTTEERAALLGQLNKQKLELGNKGILSENEQAQKRLLGLQTAALSLADAKDGGSKEAIERAARAQGLDPDELKSFMRAQGGQLALRDFNRRKQSAQTLAKEAADSLKTVDSAEGLRERLKGSGLSSSQIESVVNVERERRETLQAQERLGGVTDPEGLAAGSSAWMAEGAQHRKALHGLSTDVLRRMVQSGAGGAESEGVLSRRQALEAAQRSGRKGSTVQTLATIMGGDIDADTASMIQGAESPAARAKMMAQAMGSTKVDLKQLESVLSNLGKKGGVSAGVEGMDSLLANDDMRKELLDKRKNEQNQQAQVMDPSYRKLESMDTHLAKAVTLLGSMNEHTRATAERMSKEPEGGGA